MELICSKYVFVRLGILKKVVGRLTPKCRQKFVDIYMIRVDCRKLKGVSGITGIMRETIHTIGVVLTGMNKAIQMRNIQETIIKLI